MVINYYAKYPDPELKIVKKDVEGDHGRGSSQQRKRQMKGIMNRAA